MNKLVSRIEIELKMIGISQIELQLNEIHLKLVETGSLFVFKLKNCWEFGL